VAEKEGLTLKSGIRESTEMDSDESRLHDSSSGSKSTNNDQQQNGSGGKVAGNEKLMVALRIRPLTNEEKAQGRKIVAEKVDDKMVLLLDPGKGSTRGQPNHLRKHRSSERQYLFDVAFGADSTQEEVYLRTTKPLVDSVLEGYNATVFAYGATGSGKTYTMVGHPNSPGCMARALNDLFEAVDKSQDVVFKVSMSYLEIYNENIRDLLNPTSGHLELREDSKGHNIQVAGLSESNTKNTNEARSHLPAPNARLN